MTLRQKTGKWTKMSYLHEYIVFFLETLQRLPVSYPAPSQRITEALPRSRFHERVSRSDYRTNTGSNPFEEEETDETRSMIIRRRMKKRAPLPPPNKSMSSQHVRTIGVILFTVSLFVLDKRRQIRSFSWWFPLEFNFSRDWLFGFVV